MTTTTSEKTMRQREAAPLKVQAANFLHLYADVAWFGILYGSTLSFLAVYAARLGATGWQVGLLSAGPALVSTLLTVPVGRWVQTHSLARAVVLTAFWQRLGYFLLIPIPLLLPETMQIWAALLLTVVVAVPGTALAIGFNALLATTVPPEYRGRVVGRRNALLAGTIMISFLLSGWIADVLSFEWGYAAIFILGALGGGMSTYHLSRLKPPPMPEFQIHPLRDHAQPGRGAGLSGDVPQRMTVGMRLWLRWQPGEGSFFADISSRYWWVMLAYFLFHFAQLLPTALFPLFWVREIHLTDGEIGILNALFYLVMLMFAPFLEPLTKYMGNYRLVVTGSVLLASYPLITAFSSDLTLILVASVVGGIVWAILSGALVNRLLEVIPEDKRPSHLAVYNLTLNAATLSSTMLGPLLADVVGLREALFIIFALRIGSGLAMARWG